MTNNWAAQMAIARRFVQSGNPEQAREVIRKIRGDAPTPWQGLIYLAQAELDCGDSEVARSLRNLAEQEKASKTALTQFDIHLALHDNDTPRAIALGKKALTQERVLDLPTLLQLGETCITDGLVTDAIFFANTALDQGTDLVRLHRIKYTALIMASSDDTLEADLSASLFAETTSENHAVGLSILLMDRPKNLDIARRLLAQAEQMWPTSVHVKNAKRQLNSIDQKRPSDPKAHLEMVVEHLRSVEENLPSLAGLGAAFLKLPTADFSRPLISKYNPAGFAVSENAGTGDVMVYFKGIGPDVSSMDATDAHASAAGLSAVYLEDSSRLFFCNGTPALGPDLESTLSALQELIDGFGPRRSLTMVSTSAGGIGALLYGMRLKADRVLCYSPITFVNRKFLDAHNDKRARSVVYRLEQNVSPELLNMKTQLEASNHHPKIDLVYASGHRADHAQAEHIKGQPAVSLYPVADFDEHPTLQHAMLHGYLLNTLRGNMSIVPV